MRSPTDHGLCSKRTGDDIAALNDEDLRTHPGGTVFATPIPDSGYKLSHKHRERATASEPRERSAPTPFDGAQGVVSVVEPRSGARESV
jgi:hypothetical protein